MKESIQVRLFIGCVINSEMRLHLSLSQLWQNDKLFNQREELALKEISYQSKEYIGILLATSHIAFEQIQIKTEFIRQKLEQYCTAVCYETLKIVLLPQIFLC